MSQSNFVKGKRLINYMTGEEGKNEDDEDSFEMLEK